MQHSACAQVSPEKIQFDLECAHLCHQFNDSLSLPCSPTFKSFRCLNMSLRKQTSPMKLSSSIRFKCVSAFLCLLLPRKAVISPLRSQKRSSALPLDSHLTSLCKSRSWCSADMSDSSMRNKQCWSLDVERILLHYTTLQSNTCDLNFTFPGHMFAVMWLDGK